MSRFKKILYASIIIIFAVSFYGYSTNYKINAKLNKFVYRLPAGLHLETSLLNIFNNLDPRKIVTRTNDLDVVDLKFSTDDIKEFDNARNCSDLFLVDRCKVWRKVEFKNANFESDIKIKLSGTSITPYRKSLSFYDFVYRRLTNQSVIHDVTTGGNSYVLKFGKENFFNNSRRVSLLSPLDEWSYFQNVLNKQAEKHGLITTSGRPYLLKINGIDSGVYLAQETIGKELLERNYGITDYAILKPNDDWDSIPFGHQNHTDYVSEDKEQSGSSLKTIGIAQNRLRDMFVALETGDFETLVRYFDPNYMAKLSAMQLIYGTWHASIGDNRRYVYNIANGYFYPTFRMEGNPVKLERKDNIIPVLSGNYREDKILELFEANDDFISTRNMYLAEFISEAEEVVKKYNTYQENYDGLMQNTKRSTARLSFRNDKGIDAYHHNIKVLQNYIDYNKIYTTEIKNSLGECRYSIFVDSYSGISLAYDENDYKKNETSIKLTRGKNNVEFGSGQCVDSFQFENKLNGKTIAEDHVYYNFELDIPAYLDFNNYFEYIDDGEVIRILRGSYYVSDNIKFPEDRGVLIEPGVQIAIANNKSILFFNGVEAVGTTEQRIIFSPSETAFGSILIRANFQDVNLEYVEVYGGNEAYVEGIYASGQIVILNSNLDIKNSSFKSSLSDDGINIKYSTVNIELNTFSNNFGDQIDCDYCSGIIHNNIFTVAEKLRQMSETDGLDVSGSNLLIDNNSFSGFSDKALSIGEKSNVVLVNNFVEKSNIGAAVKDGSSACFSNNKFQSNATDITSYVKKTMYTYPDVKLANDQIIDKNIEYARLYTCDDF